MRFKIQNYVDKLENDLKEMRQKVQCWTWAGMENNELWKHMQKKPWGLWFITGRTSDKYQLSKIISHTWDLKKANAKWRWFGYDMWQVACLPYFKASLIFFSCGNSSFCCPFSVPLASNAYSLMERDRDFNRRFYWTKPNQINQWSFQHSC